MYEYLNSISMGRKYIYDKGMVAVVHVFSNEYDGDG
jgi:hypothetical protein